MPPARSIRKRYAPSSHPFPAQRNTAEIEMNRRIAGGRIEASSRKVAFASLIGTTIEWYDFFIFGTAAALIFNKVFFPSFDPVTGTLAAFASFSVGFIARPL